MLDFLATEQKLRRCRQEVQTEDQRNTLLERMKKLKAAKRIAGKRPVQSDLTAQERAVGPERVFRHPPSPIVRFFVDLMILTRALGNRLISRPRGAHLAT